ncbi:transporter [Limnoglobus roseus]|nr:transporter [Limnoglobus roseus]
MTSDPSGCYPGRFNNGVEAYPSHALGRFLYGIYNCVCLPDPCYEPKWTPLADSAFFTPTARPVTQMRFRTDLTRGLATPDRAEYFWAKGLGNTRGAQSPDGRRVDRVRDDAISMYTEAATGRVGVFTELTYHRVRPDDRPGSSGFGDLKLGTKTLLLDCELLQIAFQLQTTVPTGNTEKGLGTGHTTLEPSVILGLKLSNDSYFQAQVGEWIPLGGDTDYAGAAIQYNWSYNHVLCRPLANCPIIGTMEFRGVTFQDGAYTDPATGISLGASGNSYIGIGPGLRGFICDRADFGGAVSYGVGSAVGPRQEYRFDLRVRY